MRKIDPFFTIPTLRKSAFRTALSLGHTTSTGSSSHRLIKKSFFNPFSRAASSEKEPYYLRRAFPLGLAFYGLILGPAVVLVSSVSLINLFGGSQTQASAEGLSTMNSQRMALLAPAANLDPNPQIDVNNLPITDGSVLLPATGPEGSASDAAEIPSSSQISNYTVRAGDTLSGIAVMFNVSVNTIIWANDIKGHVIHEGDQLVILPVTGIRHTVAPGETLASLAKKYGGTPNDIATFNGLAPDATFSKGDTVIIPNGEVQFAENSPNGATGAYKHSKVASSRSHHAAIARAARGEPYLGGSGATTGNFIWPVDGGEITQGLHGWNAVDIGAPRGTSIFAAAGGTVTVARDNGGWNGGYGNYVVISHADGTQTLYAHMSRMLVSSGESVSQGQTIGEVGATGEATGSHLHFEVRGAQNPFADLPLGSSQ